MRKRVLGKTGYQVAEIGFGAWAIGDAWGDLVPEDQARNALHAALDAGMNFIDTADVYGAGRSEKIIGEVLAERDNFERVYVATKMGRGPGWDDNYDIMERAAADAITRLQVDALDLVQLHCIPTETLKAGRAFEHLEKIKDKGLIRHYGASVETIDEALFCIRHSECATLQVIFNIFRQRLIDEVFAEALEDKMGIIARVPLASGILAGKFDADHVFSEQDHRRFNANGEIFNVGETFAGVPFEDGVRLAKEIESILSDESPSASLACKALRWILDFEAVSVVIPGAKSEDQALENVRASALTRLSEGAHIKLHEFYGEFIDSLVRGAY